MTLRVLHAPLHAPSANANSQKVIDRIKALNCTSVGLTEAYGIVDKLDKLNGYRLVLEEGGKDRRRGQKDNPILVRSSLDSKGSGQLYGCDASEPLRIAPERWLTYSVVQVPGEGVVCHVCLHPHAGVQGDRGRIGLKGDRGKQFAEQMRNLSVFLDLAVASKWKTVLTGDLNFRDIGDSKLSPYKIMRDHGMQVHSQGLDAIGWTKSLKLEVDEVPGPQGATDHPWLLGKTA